MIGVAVVAGQRLKRMGLRGPDGPSDQVNKRKEKNRGSDPEGMLEDRKECQRH